MSRKSVRSSSDSIRTLHGNGLVVTVTETVANARAAPELPSCADSQIAKSQRYTHNTERTLSMHTITACQVPTSGLMLLPMSLCKQFVVR